MKLQEFKMMLPAPKAHAISPKADWPDQCDQTYHLIRQQSPVALLRAPKNSVSSCATRACVSPTAESIILYSILFPLNLSKNVYSMHRRCRMWGRWNTCLVFCARQIRMQLVLAHRRDTDQSNDGHDQTRQEDAVEGLDVGRHDAFVPALGQVLDCVQALANSLDDVRSVRFVAEALPEASLEQVLVDYAANREANSGSQTSRKIYWSVSDAPALC